MAKTEFTFRNIDKWQKRFKDPRFIGDPLRRAMDRSGQFARGQTAERTPVDTGRARNSLFHRVDPSPIPQFAEIGSNLEYMPALERGSRPHFPPLAALQPWARRHGFPAGNAGAWLVAQSIARRGTKAHHMLDEGIEATRAFFRQQLISAAREIEKSFRNIR